MIQRAFHIAAKVSAATAEDVAELYQEQQHRGHVLETGHHRMRRELDQRAPSHQSEQRLEQAAEQDDGEEYQQRGGDVGFSVHRGGAMQQGLEQQPKKECRGDPRRVDARRAVAE